ncbi:hypothetical protein INR49_029096 [Caranx melampygus]|nr:hypothetical protein INR49_029096 [Caranx melampygus]
MRLWGLLVSVYGDEAGNQKDGGIGYCDSISQYRSGRWSWWIPMMLDEKRVPGTIFSHMSLEIHPQLHLPGSSLKDCSPLLILKNLFNLYAIFSHRQDAAAGASSSYSTIVIHLSTAAQSRHMSKRKHTVLHTANRRGRGREELLASSELKENRDPPLIMLPPYLDTIGELSGLKKAESK